MWYTIINVAECLKSEKEDNEIVKMIGKHSDLKKNKVTYLNELISWEL